MFSKFSILRRGSRYHTGDLKMFEKEENRYIMGESWVYRIITHIIINNCQKDYLTRTTQYLRKGDVDLQLNFHVQQKNAFLWKNTEFFLLGIPRTNAQQTGTSFIFPDYLVYTRCCTYMAEKSMNNPLNALGCNIKLNWKIDSEWIILPIEKINLVFDCP